MPDSPFETLESAHEYVVLLAQQVEDVRRGLGEDIARSTGNGASRRLDALRLVDYKLHQLDEHLAKSRRILNDLRVLRRLLMAERESHSARDDDSTVVPTSAATAS